jgi:uncharacterized damage-inducible protein DinB
MPNPSLENLKMKNDNGNLISCFVAELEREAESTRRALERVPEGQNSWKPHPRSMELGSLAALIAHMPSWVVSIIRDDELDLRSPAAAEFRASNGWQKREELLAALDAATAQAREALQNTSEDHLHKIWKLKIGEHIANESPRHVMIQESVFSHLAHHRGQLTVYLRLHNAPVPAIYGPSADEGKVA